MEADEKREKDYEERFNAIERRALRSEQRVLELEKLEGER